MQYMEKPFKNRLLLTSGLISMKLDMKRLGIKPIIVYSNDEWVDLDLFYSKVRFCNLGIYIGKCDKDGFFGNYWSLWQNKNLL